MIIRKYMRNQYSLGSVLIFTNLVLLFTKVECLNKKECDYKCIKSCPHEEEDVCGSDGMIYPNPCILKCCGEAEVDTSVCSENGMRRAHTGIELKIGNSTTTNKKSTKNRERNNHNRVPCEIDCYNSCTDDEAPVCGDNAKIFENVCKMDCCGIDEAKMKFCKDSGSQKAKVVKVQNVEHWKQLNAENDKLPNEKDQHTSTNMNTDAQKSTVSPKEYDKSKDEVNKEKERNMHITSTSERIAAHTENKTESSSRNKKKKFVGGTNQSDEDQKGEKYSTKHNDKTRGNAVLQKRDQNDSKYIYEIIPKDEKGKVKS